ncbi:MAG: hypothetical protein AAGC47_08110, partial [Bacteroidota bacterium]
MRKIYLLGLLFISALIQAQPYGNEWIDYDQRYFKFQIVEDGVYRITFNDLANAGIAISGINPQNIQLFAGTEEIPIYIEGEEDGFFNSTDYIEFVGRKNDGRLETKLYDSQDDQPNAEYSLFNDTLNYFISWNSTGNNLRFQENDLSQIDDYSSPDFVWKRNQVVYNNGYYEGQRDQLGISIPFYVKGEGWMSGRFGFPEGSSSLTVNLNTTGVFQADGAPPAELTSVSAGVSNAPTSGNNHFLQIRYGESNLLAVNQQFQGYEVNRFDFNIPNNQIGSTTTGVKYEVSNSLGVASDYQAVASLEILYPHIVDLGVTG